MIGNALAVVVDVFCREGTLLQSTCAAKELLYWIMPSCEQNRKTVDIAGASWATLTSILGWSVKGIWPEGVF